MSGWCRGIYCAKYFCPGGGMAARFKRNMNVQGEKFKWGQEKWRKLNTFSGWFYKKICLLSYFFNC